MTTSSWQKWNSVWNILDMWISWQTWKNIAIFVQKIPWSIMVCVIVCIKHNRCVWLFYLFRFPQPQDMPLYCCQKKKKKNYYNSWWCTFLSYVNCLRTNVKSLGAQRNVDYAVHHLWIWFIYLFILDMGHLFTYSSASSWQWGIVPEALAFYPGLYWRQLRPLQ